MLKSFVKVGLVLGLSVGSLSAEIYSVKGNVLWFACKKKSDINLATLYQMKNNMNGLQTLLNERKCLGEQNSKNMSFSTSDKLVKMPSQYGGGYTSSAIKGKIIFPNGNEIGPFYTNSIYLKVK